MRALADSASNLNETERLWNSGASVTRSTDLKPSPNLPIADVPSFGESRANISARIPSSSIGLPSSAQ